LEYPDYAINRAIVFHVWMVLVWDSGTLCENAALAFNRYTISRSNPYSLCEV